MWYREMTSPKFSVSEAIDKAITQLERVKVTRTSRRHVFHQELTIVNCDVFTIVNSLVLEIGRCYI